MVDVSSTEQTVNDEPRRALHTKPVKEHLGEVVLHRVSCKIPQMWAGNVMRHGITRTQAPKNATKPDLFVHTMPCTPTNGEMSDNGHGNVS